MSVAGRFIVWALSVYGVTLIVTGSGIFRPLRKAISTRWRGSWLCQLIHCNICIGFWAGVVASLVGCSLVALGAEGTWAEGGGWHRALRAWADGCAGAAWCFAVHVVLAKLGAEDL